MRSSCQVGEVEVQGTEDAAKATATMLGLKLDSKSQVPLVDAVLICNGNIVSTQQVALQTCAL